jgi:hypothetical protein
VTPADVLYLGICRAVAGYALRLVNDQADGLPALLGAAFGVVDRWVASGAAVYLFHPTGGSLPVFVDAFVGVGWELRQSLVWAKDAVVLGHADDHFQHEGILYGYKPLEGRGRLGRGGLGWYGDNRQVSVFEVPRPRGAGASDNQAAGVVGADDPKLDPPACRCGGSVCGVGVDAGGVRAARPARPPGGTRRRLLRRDHRPV